MEKIKLSICIVSYNQLEYLKELLESIFLQNLQIPYEIVIGDDASKDGTSKYLLKLQKQYPNLIKPILREKNLGLCGNLFKTTQACQGEYIAHIDSDDLMLPNKLNTQLNFLEKNPDYVMVHHRVNLIDAHGKEIGQGKKKNLDTATIDDLIYKNRVTHSSKMFRRSSLDKLSFTLPHTNKIPDWYLHIGNARYGKIKYLPEILGSYRILNTSAQRSHKAFRLAYDEVFILKQACKTFKEVNPQIIKKAVANIYNQQLRRCIKEKSLLRSFYYAKKSCNETITLNLLRLLLKLYTKKLLGSFK